MASTGNVDWGFDWRNCMIICVLTSCFWALAAILQVVIAYGTAYICFLWLYFAGTGTWVYRALDWSKAMNCIYYAALPILLILAFCIM